MDTLNSICSDIIWHNIIAKLNISCLFPKKHEFDVCFDAIDGCFDVFDVCLGLLDACLMYTIIFKKYSSNYRTRFFHFSPRKHMILAGKKIFLEKSNFTQNFFLLENTILLILCSRDFSWSRVCCPFIIT